MERRKQQRKTSRNYFSLLTFFLFLAVGPVLTKAELDKILAVVEEDVILESELSDQMSRVRNQIRAQGTRMPPASVLERQVLERLVFEKIQLAVALQSGVEVSDKSLARALADIARKNNLSKDEFIKTITDEGYDLDYFRNQIRQEILIAKLRKNEIDKRVRVAPSEIEHYLRNESNTGDSQEEYRLSHILVSIPVNATNSELKDSREKVEEARKAVINGDDFSAVAISVSDSTNALEGGDLGWRKGTEIPSIFADSVSTMEKGEISNVITNSSGFHLIQLTDQRS
ncbi:MAG: peptidylprolyl isomerase, partial [Pseudomonadota bacterium]|nr:peptidylprolyl isomerase [Pseudomonadota bacterium]